MLWIDPHCRRYCILCLVQWRRHRGVQTVHWIWAPSSWGPRVGPQKIQKMYEMTHLHSTHRVSNSRRGHLRTRKVPKPLAAGGPHWGSLHRSRGPVAGPPQSPIPALSTSGFQLQPLGPKQLKAPQVTVESGSPRALLRRWPCDSLIQTAVQCVTALHVHLCRLLVLVWKCSEIK